MFAASSRGAQNASLSSDTIAADIAAFKTHGGRIEVLGTTPLRTQAQGPAFRSKSTTAKSAAKSTPKRAAAAAAPSATKKSAG
ncbi:hypothetical protein JGR64_08155 [Luteimonas sp. MC1572]|nr:hypothetical protein [Luteimonas sp. MC1572]MBJ7573906.1 hypothetical protein [Luteimonas sp. MC1828]QQO04563.1 hypothetical protein JGR64_08155 [Luteimonas sp. MC1572]